MRPMRLYARLAEWPRLSIGTILKAVNESMRLDDPFTLPDHIVFVESTGFRNSALLMLDPMIIDGEYEYSS
jgi:hypothetical protein